MMVDIAQKFLAFIFESSARMTSSFLFFLQKKQTESMPSTYTFPFNLLLIKRIRMTFEPLTNFVSLL